MIVCIPLVMEEKCIYRLGPTANLEKLGLGDRPIKKVVAMCRGHLCLWRIRGMEDIPVCSQEETEKDDCEINREYRDGRRRVRGGRF